MKFTARAFDFAKKAIGDDIPLFAANASFFIAISAFPAMLLLLYVIQFTPLTREDLLEFSAGFVPEMLTPLISYISEDIYSAPGGTIISLSALTGVWAASRGVYSVLDGLNAVFDLEESRNFVFRRLISLVYTLGIVLAVILTLLLRVFGGRLLTDALPEPLRFILGFRTPILLLFLTGLFTLVYMVFPNRRAGFRSQLPGALGAALAWIIFSYLFSVYVNYFSDYSRIYGSLTTIVLALLWLYICMCILLLGGSFNAWLGSRDG